MKRLLATLALMFIWFFEKFILFVIKIDDLNMQSAFIALLLLISFGGYIIGMKSVTLKISYREKLYAALTDEKRLVYVPTKH